MIDVIIDNRDFNYLTESNLNTNLKNLIIHNHCKNFDRIYLKIDKISGQEILDFLSNELAKAGFKENDEPNGLGLFIENIIDKFYREVYNT